ncbi:MAG: hypothetical protein JW726_06200 [Anaerolineales bacterium]|nr:hypothetical protein [Anaerolineales bacterium]
MRTNQIDYPDDKKLLRIADAANWIAKLFIVLYVIYACVKSWNYFSDILSQPNWWNYSFDIFTFIVGIFESLIFALFAYVVLRGIEEIIYLLMDIRAVVDVDEMQSDFQADIVSNSEKV